MQLLEEQDRVAATAPEGPAPRVFEAIVRKRCLTATYNRTQVLMAPHAAWTKHGDLFVDGVTLRLNGAPPREPKLGTFKLIGLGDLAVTDQPFFVSDLFNPGDAKYGGELLLSVEPD
ncbi:hypothetical protein [Sphingomonas baiyangensis]|uniref:Uncharacterized protein n=1 Tax=Sphingomonas baiyangensis TaxID=2572576 RepID=A0A4U1L2R3_9SPHN|nr:hypothetical protein [Sphingomonas baiyangensis]TKD50325.1 hypothetical protein FBR43_05780 [Sphingomonas baiyangensis]